MKIANIEYHDHMLSLTGELDYFNVMSIYNKSVSFLTIDSHPVMIDFSQLQTANSAAIAIMLEWKKFAATHAKKIAFQGVSKELNNIAKASSLEALILEPVVAISA